MNNYNPLLLMLWKANIDVQFVAESSLALAHYVSGHVTKVERSNMQEIWQEVSENKSVYSCLWSFGMEVCAFDSAACMRRVICCSAITSLKSLTLSSG